jgi:hypothetical protein
MWQVGTGWKLGEFAGVSGTVTLPSGASIILIIAHSAGGGSLQILGGVTVPIIAGANQLTIQNYHPLHQANAGSAAKTLVFTGTDSYYVQYATPGNV